jgi:hypothetical protein
MDSQSSAVATSNPTFKLTAASALRLLAGSSSVDTTDLRALQAKAFHQSLLVKKRIDVVCQVVVLDAPALPDEMQDTDRCFDRHNLSLSLRVAASANASSTALIG